MHCNRTGNQCAKREDMSKRKQVFRIVIILIPAEEELHSKDVECRIMTCPPWSGIIFHHHTGMHCEGRDSNFQHTALLSEGEPLIAGDRPNSRHSLGNACFQRDTGNGWKVLDYFAVSALQCRTVKQMRNVSMLRLDRKSVV